jgi:hypothetical protein
VPEQPLRQVLIEVEKAHDRPNQKNTADSFAKRAYDHFPFVVSAYPKINPFALEFGTL